MNPKSKIVKLFRLSALLLPLLLLNAQSVQAFCGFFVAKADTKLFNKASKVVIVRDEDKTVLTMANDFKGDPREFGIVIPVPTKIEREQINVASKGIIDHLDAYSSPRLVEYHDHNPCEMRMMEMMAAGAPRSSAVAKDGRKKRAESLGVTIEAEYTVGEYDIVILSAKQSGGLETFLKEQGYKVPDGAAKVLGSYIKQDMRFFLAKVNLEEQSKLGFTFLRPLQVAYTSKKFMLPIRLGMLNADGEQELFAFILTKKGRVETTNYRTVKLPQGMDIPVFVKDDFANFYRDMFGKQVKKENNRAVFLEYAWDMGWCDPCAADPLSASELKELGVFWLDPVKIQPLPGPPARGPKTSIMPPRPQNVFITRLHVRYDKENFPEDLFFQQTSDRRNFQARYVLRHPWTGSAQCSQADAYRKTLPERFRKEAETLATLTGWEMAEIRSRMKEGGLKVGDGDSSENENSGGKWWKGLWK